MSRKNDDLFSELLVGVFMIAVVLALGWFTIVISGVDLVLGRAKTSAHVTFTDVGGLKARDSVLYRGMKVGTVERIDLSKKDIAVTLAVDKDVVLRDGYRISVAALSLLGGNYLLLEEGDGAPLPLETTLFRGEAPVDWMREVGKIAQELGKLTSGGGLRGIVTNIEATAANLNTIIARVERGEGTVGKLLSADETMYADLKSAVGDARTTFDSASAIAARLEKGQGTVGRLLSTNDTVYVDLSRTLANAADVSDRIAAGEGLVGKLVSTNDALYAELRASVANIKAITERVNKGEGLLGRVTNDKQLADHAAKLLADLEQVSERLAAGKGTLGKLSKDEALYNDVNGLIKDVRQVIDNYRDTTPISSFAGLIGGAL